MKKILILFLSITYSLTNICYAQKAKKPTIMIVPSDNWCIQNGYVQTFNNQGTQRTVPDYRKALQNSSELLQVISQINGMMAERGFPLKDLEGSLNQLEQESADDAIRMSSKTGSGVNLSPTDQLKMVAKADIWMQLTWTVEKKGPKKSISFNLRGLDAYTNKQVATAVGTGMPSMNANIPQLLEEAVLAHIDNFNATLMDYFDDLFENGREVILRVKIWDDWDEDLESEFGEDEEELMYIIEDWLEENTMGSNFNVTDATENMMYVEQIRIPLSVTDDKGREKSFSVRKLGRSLKKYLDKEFEIESKVENTGLGKLTIWLGHK